MDLFSDLQQLMVEHRFRPNKKLAQHFIVNESLIQKMLKEADLKENDKVLEIGSGVGFLTQFLLEHSNVVGVELDEGLTEILEKRFSRKKNFELVKGNFLKVSLPKFNKVVSFPPYHISGEIILRLLKEDFDLAVLVFQKEFTEKLVAEPGFKEYSYLSVLTDYLFEKEIVIANIQPNSFYPKPESYSSLIKFVRKKKIEKIKDFDKFGLFVKNIFRYKNKNLSNSLKNCFKDMGKDFNMSSDEALKEIEELGLGDLKTNLLYAEDCVNIFKKISQE